MIYKSETFSNLIIHFGSQCKAALEEDLQDEDNTFQTNLSNVDVFSYRILIALELKILAQYILKVILI